MKNLILVFFGLILFFNFLQAQSSWQILTSPINENFVSVCFTDNDNGVIVSEEGSILSTTDGGYNWQLSSFPGYHFSGVCFTDIQHGCIVGWQELPADSSLILVTFDGGANWSTIDHYRVNRFSDVFFINNDIGWAVGSQDELNMNCCFYTDDGGLTWDYQSSILMVGAELFGVHFRNENHGSVCGADGAFFITNSGGTQGWAMGISMPILNLNDIYNFGLLAGCIVGDEGTVLYTTNNWYQYIEQTSNTTEDLHGVSGNPPTNELWAVGNNGTIIYSPNYLLGWTTQTSGVAENLNDVFMTGSSNGWAVGENGTILHYTEEVGIFNSDEHLDFQVCPNPANDVLKIKFSANIFLSSVSVINMVGAEVFHLDVNRNCHEQKLNLSDLPSGIYMLNLVTTTGAKNTLFLVY